MTPTQRSLKHLRDLGYVTEVVERWIPGANIRKDLLGFVDLIAWTPAGETIAVQATSGSNVAHRVKKITESPNLAVLRRCGWQVLVFGWRKAANGRWTLRVVDLS